MTLAPRIRIAILAPLLAIELARLAAAPAPAAAPTPEDALALVHVRDPLRYGRGTAAFLGGGRWAVTAAHVVSIPIGKSDRLHSQRITLHSAWDGRSYAATVAAIDAEADVALLRVEARGLPSLRPAASPPAAPDGRAVWLMGLPLPAGDAPGGPHRCETELATAVSHHGGAIWLLEACPDVQAGWSGAPVVDARSGELIAVFHSMFRPKGQGQERFPAVTPLTRLDTLLAAAKSTPASDPPAERPEHTAGRLRLALQVVGAYAAGQFPRAVTYQRQRCELDPDDPEQRAELAELLLLANERDEALAEIDAALLARPAQAEWQLLRGQILLDGARFLQAEAAFRHGLERRPNDLELRHGLAQAQEYGNRPSEAEATFQMMLKQAPNHPLVLLRWGEYLERRGDFKAARKPLQDAATLVGSEPSTLRIHLRYGRNLELNGRYKPAEKEYRLALQIDPGNAVGYLYLGNLLRKQRRYDEAQSVVDAGLTIPNLTTVVVDQLRDLRARINGGGL